MTSSQGVHHLLAPCSATIRETARPVCLGGSVAAKTSRIRAKSGSGKKACVGGCESACAARISATLGSRVRNARTIASSGGGRRGAPRSSASAKVPQNSAWRLAAAATVEFRKWSRTSRSSAATRASAVSGWAIECRSSRSSAATNALSRPTGSSESSTARMPPSSNCGTMPFSAWRNARRNEAWRSLSFERRHAAMSSPKRTKASNRPGVRTRSPIPPSTAPISSSSNSPRAKTSVTVPKHAPPSPPGRSISHSSSSLGSRGPVTRSVMEKLHVDTVDRRIDSMSAADAARTRLRDVGFLSGGWGVR